MVEHFDRLFISIDVRLRDLLESERGQAFVEYALLLVAVSVTIFAALNWGTFSGAISTALGKVEKALTG